MEYEGDDDDTNCNWLSKRTKRVGNQSMCEDHLNYSIVVVR